VEVMQDFLDKLLLNFNGQEFVTDDYKVDKDNCNLVASYCPPTCIDMYLTNAALSEPADNNSG
jgi:hypothetical protein